MPVNFGGQATEASEIPSHMTPSRGVGQDYSWLSSAAHMFGQVEDIVGEENKKKAQSTLSEFTRQQLLVAEGVSQKKYSSAFARTQMRRNLIQAIESNPALSQDFVQAQGRILGVAGGAQVVDEGTKEEQRREGMIDQMVQDGYISPDASEEEIDKGLSYIQTARAAQDRFDERMRTLNLELKNKEVSSARRGEVEELKQLETQRYLGDLLPAQFQGMETRLNEIVRGQGSEAEKIQQIEDTFLEFRQGVSQFESLLPSTMTQALLRPFDMLKENYLQKAAGTLSDEELKRQNERTILIATNIALSDPNVVGLAVSSKLFPSAMQGWAAVGGGRETINSVMDFIPKLTGENEDNPDPYTNDSKKKDAMKISFDSVIQGLNSDDEATKQASIKALNRLFEGAEDSGNKIARDPKAARGLMDFFASPEFLKAVNTDGVSKDALEGAADILGRNYADEVWGMVRSEFRNNRVFDETIIERQEQGKPRQLIGEGAEQQTIPADPTIPTKDVVLYKNTSSGIQFYAADRTNTEAVTRARQLNKDLKPIINKTVRGMAHLEGRSDYGQYWSEIADQVMGGTVTGKGGKSEVAGGDAGDDLEMSDFIYPAASTVGLPKEVAKDEPFLSSVEELAAKHEVDPSVILGIMDFETGGTFSPAQKNAAGSSGTGLIQFMANTAKGLGTTVEKLAGMDRLEQMAYVEKYFDRYGSKLKGASAEDFYMAVLYPKAINKSGDYVLFKKGTTAYSQNSGLDKNGDGTVTKAEASAAVLNRVKAHSTA